MALVGRTYPREVPHERGNFFHFRELSGKEREDAALETAKRAMAAFAGLDENVTRLATEALEKRAAQEKADALVATVTQNEQGAGATPAKTPMLGETLLRLGLVAWDGPVYSEIPLTQESKDLLDEVTRDWAIGELRAINERTSGESPASALTSSQDGGLPNSSTPSESDSSE